MRLPYVGRLSSRPIFRKVEEEMRPKPRFQRARAVLGRRWWCRSWMARARRMADRRSVRMEL